MSVVLDKNISKELSKSSITQILVLNSDRILFLDYEGKLYINKEKNNFGFFYQKEDDFVTIFDVIKSSKEAFDLVAVGTENGSLVLINRAGNVEKSIKEAHSGSVVKVLFSNDFQTIVTSGEDNVIKLWSRLGMLRSEIFKGDTPLYSLAWGPDDQTIAIGGSKIMTLKSIKPGIKDVVSRASDQGVILLIKWSKQENLIFSTGEDCRFIIWDNLGRIQYTSQIFENPFTYGEWTQGSSHILLSSCSEIILVKKNGKLV